MKKIFYITTLLIIMITSVSVFATSVEITEEGRVDTAVTYGVSEGFQIIIPPDFTLDGTNESVQQVKAENVYIGYGKTLKIEVSSENYENGWYLIDTIDATNKALYEIGRSTGASDVTNENNIVLEVEAGNVDGVTNNLYFRVPVLPEYAGTYQDRLKFAVVIE